MSMTWHQRLFDIMKLIHLSGIFSIYRHL